ncbi:unnamed protein product [Phytophthora fragariaefolia]|uniref:Unnamed protein product n=1 Tax=Phytophthora fragariaefolia TaxID=1490495 RepID=A0A9W7CZM2_9STRA|nr:unnamed protein product [Phytophthora fragariaefolia]
MVTPEAARQKPVHALPEVQNGKNAAEVCHHGVPTPMAMGAAMCNDAQAAEQVRRLGWYPHPSTLALNPIDAFIQIRQLGLAPELALGHSDCVHVRPHDAIVIEWP